MNKFGFREHRRDFIQGGKLVTLAVWYDGEGGSFFSVDSQKLETLNHWPMHGLSLKVETK